MTTKICMTQTRRAPGKGEYVAGQEYPVDDAFAAQMVQQGFAKLAITKARTKRAPAGMDDAAGGKSDDD